MYFFLSFFLAHLHTLYNRKTMATTVDPYLAPLFYVAAYIHYLPSLFVHFFFLLPLSILYQAMGPLDSMAFLCFVTVFFLEDGPNKTDGKSSST